MDTIVIMRVKGDPAKLEEFAQADPERMRRITERAREQGCIHHTFLGGDGEIIVLDEWRDEAGFRSFFEGDEEVPEVMKEIAEGEPQIEFLRPLNTGDHF